MPGKSRNKPSRNKRVKSGHGASSISKPPSAVVAPTSQPIAQQKVSARAAAVPAPVAAALATRYPYLTAELRRIGILTGIALTILVILALVLA